MALPEIANSYLHSNIANLMKEPISTLTSAAYIAAGVAIALQDPASELLILSMWCLGIFSGVFHADSSQHGTPAHRADEGAIYVVLGTFFWITWNSDLAVFGLVAIFISVAMLRLKDIDLFLVTPIAVGFILLGLFLRVGLLWFTYVALLAVAAMAIRTIKRRHQPDWLHGLWHLLSAGALYLTWHAMHFHS